MVNRNLLILYSVALLRSAIFQPSVREFGCLELAVGSPLQQTFRKSHQPVMRRSLQRDDVVDETISVITGLLRSVDLTHLPARQNRTVESDINERLSKIREQRHKARDNFGPLYHRKSIAGDCARECEDIVQPLCGSDDVTYKNACEFEAALCANQNLFVARRTPCNYEAIPNGHWPLHSSTPAPILTGTPTTFELKPPTGPTQPTGDPANIFRGKCPDSCYETLHPVCGSDGRTYQNLCYLLKAACRVEGLGHTADGPCQDKNKANSEEKTLNEEKLVSYSQNSVAKNLESEEPGCNLNCTAEGVRICGSDGQTYDNLCHLKEANCRNDVKVAHMGRCVDPNSEAPARYDSKNLQKVGKNPGSVAKDESAIASEGDVPERLTLINMFEEIFV